MIFLVIRFNRIKISVKGFRDERYSTFRGRIFWIVRMVMMDFFFSLFIIASIQLWRGAIPIFINDTRLRSDEGIEFLELIGVLKNIFKISIRRTIEGRVWKMK